MTKTQEKSQGIRKESDYWYVFLHATQAVEQFASSALELIGLTQEAEQLKRLSPVDEWNVDLVMETLLGISRRITKERTGTLWGRQKTDLYTRLNNTEERQLLCELVIISVYRNCVQAKEAYDNIKKNLRLESKNLNLVSKDVLSTVVFTHEKQREIPNGKDKGKENRTGIK